MLSTYFKEKKGFERTLKLLKEKYISLGRYSGTITIKNITKEEAEDFTDFFGKKYQIGETVKISFKNIEKALTHTMYENFSWEELFKNYFKETIIDKKTKQQIKQNNYNLFYIKVKEKLTKEEKEFLDKVRKEKNIENILIKRYKKDAKKWEEELIILMKLIFKIERETPTTLAMFAALSKNPHFLDFKTNNMTLFLKFLSIYKNVEEPKTTIEKVELLESVGISIDTISNFCITYGLISKSNLVSSFYKENQILNINLSNLSVINDLDTKEKCVFVFENPSLLNEFKTLEIPIIITSGNANLTVYKVLELLEKSKNTIYYNGDFDPEGLLNAEKLKNKFPNLKLFCYEEKNFWSSISEEKISESRLNKLNSMNNVELEAIKKCLQKTKKAAYQEKNKENIKKIMLESIKK